MNEEVRDIVEQFTDSDDIDFSLQESVSDSDSDGYSPDDNSNFGRDSVEPISDNVDELDKFFETRNTNENLVPIGHRHIKHGKGSRVSPVDLKSKSKAEQVWYAALWKTMRGWFGLNQPSTKVAPAQ